MRSSSSRISSDRDGPRADADLRGLPDHFRSNPDAGEVGLAVDPEGIGALRDRHPGCAPPNCWAQRSATFAAPTTAQSSMFGARTPRTAGCRSKRRWLRASSTISTVAPSGSQPRPGSAPPPAGIGLLAANGVVVCGCRGWPDIAGHTAMPGAARFSPRPYRLRPPQRR
jgi:hypothetical protein